MGLMVKKKLKDAKNYEIDGGTEVDFVFLP
jgi:hypothetical protein